MEDGEMNINYNSNHTPGRAIANYYAWLLIACACFYYACDVPKGPGNGHWQNATPHIMSPTDISRYPYVVDLGLKVETGTILLFQIDNTYGAIIPTLQADMVGSGTTWNIWHNASGRSRFSLFNQIYIGQMTVWKSNGNSQNDTRYIFGPGYIQWYGYRRDVGIFCPNSRVLLCPTSLRSINEVRDAADRQWHYYAGLERYDLATTANLSLDDPIGVK
jgi:hypothetical protein